MRESEQMFLVSISGLNTSTEMFMPLVNGVINKALLYTSPHVNKTTHQIIQILDVCLVNSMLHNASDLVVDRIKVWAIWWQQIWRDECIKLAEWVWPSGRTLMRTFTVLI